MYCLTYYTRSQTVNSDMITLSLVFLLIFEECTVQGGGSKDWDRHTEIYGLVTRLREIQSGE